jgi:predicted HTH domain antitoxin
LQDEESARLQYKKYTSLLQKLESGEHDKLHAERVHGTVEELQTQIISLDEAVTLACLSISKIRDELYPQIIELSAWLVLTKMLNSHKFALSEATFSCMGYIFNT